MFPEVILEQLSSYMEVHSKRLATRLCMPSSQQRGFLQTGTVGLICTGTWQACAGARRFKKTRLPRPRHTCGFHSAKRRFRARLAAPRK
jgi:hypothetical protein